jgi:hypothetical protein
MRLNDDELNKSDDLILKPDYSIRYPNKELLKKDARPSIYRINTSSWQVLAIAASFALFILFQFSFRRTQDHTFDKQDMSLIQSNKTSALVIHNTNFNKNKEIKPNLKSASLSSHFSHFTSQANTPAIPIEKIQPSISSLEPGVQIQEKAAPMAVAEMYKSESNSGSNIAISSDVPNISKKAQNVTFTSSDSYNDKNDDEGLLEVIGSVVKKHITVKKEKDEEGKYLSLTFDAGGLKYSGRIRSDF